MPSDTKHRGWNEEKSLALTIGCVWVVLGLCIVFALTNPFVWQWFLGYFRPQLSRFRGWFIATSYLALVPAVTALWLLLRLLSNLRAGLVFVARNVQALRGISRCCALACLVCAASAWYWPPFLVMAGAFGLMALLLHTVKNCFAQAVAMKDELDYTV